ncbi:MAG: tetratricopeptide repeat protein [Planctomycetes bacterium]|nr:tetratricopeptide repeat protein [Planctomycetota bacterium]
MPAAVVYAFAVADGLTPVVGAAPFDVLARQLPRMLVMRLNGDGDRGVRFFPFLGPVDGERTFLRLREPFEPKVLRELHKQGEVELLADAWLHQERIVWRVIDGRSGSVRKSIELPFDAAQPLDVLPRLEFELMDLLGWSGRPARSPALAGPALGWFLVLKDELLRREANLPEASADPLRCAERCVELAAEDTDVQQLVIDYLALLLRRGQHQERVAQVVAALAPSVNEPVVLDRLGGLALAAGNENAAAAIVCRAALQNPHDRDLVERAASLAFRVGDDDGLQRIVAAARAAGTATPSALAQLAASCDRRGDHVGRQRLVAELVGNDDLPVPVARLVITFLLDEQKASEARAVAERALEKAPDQAMLHFELGRACLQLDQTARASTAMQRALDLGLKPEVAGQARRLLRLSLVPGLWVGTQLVEKAIACGDLGAALGAVRALVRRVGAAAEAWLMFGIVCHKLGRGRRAERLLRRALRCDDDCAEAHNRLGVVLLQKGAIAEGCAHLERAHALAPDDSSTLLHLAQGSALAGRFDEATRHLEAAARRGAEPRLVEAVRREIFASRD